MRLADTASLTQYGKSVGEPAKDANHAHGVDDMIGKRQLPRISNGGTNVPQARDHCGKPDGL
jgi:hypothetical protein